MKVFFLFPMNSDLRFVLFCFGYARRGLGLPIRFVGGFASFGDGHGSPWKK
jgi:hypothetical protein